MLRKLITSIRRQTPRRLFSEVSQVESESPLQENEENLNELEYLIDFKNIDLELYRDMDSKIKKCSGYALLEVEPFPRMKIMKLGQMILYNLEHKIPEQAMYRIYMGRVFICSFILKIRMIWGLNINVFISNFKFNISYFSWIS